MTQRQELENTNSRGAKWSFWIPKAARLGFKIQLNLDSQLQAEASGQWLPEAAL